MKTILCVCMYIGILFFFPATGMPQTLALYLNAEDGTEMLEGTHGDFTITSTLSVLAGESVCFEPGRGEDLWRYEDATQSFTIRNNGDDDMVRIDLEGILYNGAAGRSALVICTRRMEDENSSILVPPLTNSFTTSSGTCTVYAYHTPYESDGVERYPRHFTFTTAGVTNGYPSIQSIAVYTNRMPTGIKEVESSALTFERRTDKVLFNDIAESVTLSSLSGKVLSVHKNIREMSLCGFPSGLYILQAVDKKGNRISAKLVK